MIKQCAVTNIQSRSECNPYDITGFLPLICSNMYSVVDKHNAHIFLQNKIKVCMPRKEYMDDNYQHCSDENYFDSYSLSEFIENFISSQDGFLTNKDGNLVKTSVCIDTAAGHLSSLHNAIRKAKEIHGSNLIIMAGNVASVEAFVELAKTGVDYIRVGIGGGGGCNTTSNTGVGQQSLEKLISICKEVKDVSLHYSQQELQHGATFFKVHSFTQNAILGTPQDFKNISKVKIIADGISSYIKQCEKEYGFNDNGYAAINKLLFAGADLVMVGKLFAQCVESAGEKQYAIHRGENSYKTVRKEEFTKYLSELGVTDFEPFPFAVKYSGMSTQEEQAKYKNVDFKIHVIDSSEPYTVILDTDQLKIGHILETKLSDKSGNVYRLSIKLTSNSENVTNSSFKYTYESKTLDNFPLGTVFKLITTNIKPSEGSVQWIPVRWTLNEWLNGSDKQDEAPYLMGWINSLKSAMAYTGKTKL